MDKKIKQVIRDSIAIKTAILQDATLLAEIEKVVTACINAFRADQKMLFCGNGGSAADAQHLASELSGRFYLDRPPLSAEALHVNTSFLTAVANDYHFDLAYARAIQAKGKPGDVLFAISTSGNSPNVVNAVDTAKSMGLLTIGMTGQSGGALAERVDHLLNMPASDTPRIQECHILVGHIICELVEAEMFGN